MSTSTETPPARVPPGPLVVVGMLLFDILSIGPRARLIDEGYLTDNNHLIRILYLPVSWAMQHNELVRDLVFAYLYLWGVRIS